MRGVMLLYFFTFVYTLILSYVIYSYLLFYRLRGVFFILQATWCFYYFTGYVVFLLFHRLRGNSQFGIRSLVYPGYL